MSGVFLFDVISVFFFFFFIVCVAHNEIQTIYALFLFWSIRERKNRISLKNLYIQPKMSAVFLLFSQNNIEARKIPTHIQVLLVYEEKKRESAEEEDDEKSVRKYRFIALTM